MTLVVVILAIVLLALIVVSGRKEKWDVRCLVTAAMCIAMSMALSYIRLFRLPQGGTITPASMLPLILFVLAYGGMKGIVVCSAYGLLQLLIDPYVIHPIQMLVDYPMAYGVMAAAAFVNLMPVKGRPRFIIAIIIAFVARWIMAVLSGVIFFAEYAGEQNVWIYSTGYNAMYLAPDAAVCCIVACVPGIERLIDFARRPKAQKV